MKAIEKGWNIFLKVLLAAVAVVMFALVITTGWQVLSRYVAQKPQVWPTDIATYALVFLTFIGMGILIKEDGHTRVDIVYLKLHPKAQKGLDIVMDVIGVITLAVVTYFATKLCISYQQKNMFLIGSVFRMPKYIMFSFIPIGTAVSTIEYIRRLIKDIKRVPTVEKEDEA